MQPWHRRPWSASRRPGVAPSVLSLVVTVQTPPKLVILVTEDRYVWSHRLPLARGARAAGWHVILATRVAEHGAPIRAAGFDLVALPWRRRGGGLLAELRTLWMLYRLYRRERPEIVHQLAVKPVIYGGLAARLAGVRGRVATITGLGHVFTNDGRKAQLLRPLVERALRLATAGGEVTVQNPDDATVLLAAGIVPQARLTLIRGSGVDLDRFPMTSEPETRPIVAAMVSRMVRDKGAGVFAAAAALLRETHVPVRCRLVGDVDPENHASHTAAELAGWVEGGAIEWPGGTDDVPAVWRDSHIAVYPSAYGEGIPKALLEAAASGRPIVTTDMPGCREVVRDGENGFLVPPRDPAALAAAIERLVADPALRAAAWGRPAAAWPKRRSATPGSWRRRWRSIAGLWSVSR